jgi:hypothetical protein
VSLSVPWCVLFNTPCFWCELSDYLPVSQKARSLLSSTPGWSSQWFPCTVVCLPKRESVQTSILSLCKMDSAPWFFRSFSGHPCNKLPSANKHLYSRKEIRKRNIHTSECAHLPPPFLSHSLALTVRRSRNTGRTTFLYRDTPRYSASRFRAALARRFSIHFIYTWRGKSGSQSTIKSYSFLHIPCICLKKPKKIGPLSHTQ